MPIYVGSAPVVSIKFGNIDTSAFLNSTALLGTITPVFPAFAFEPEATAVINAKTAAGETLSNGRKYNINKVVKRLKDCGVWSIAQASPLASRLNVFPTETAGAGDLVNWFNPGVGDCVVAGTPVFTTQRGYTFGVAGRALRTGVTLTQIDPNNHHVQVWTSTGITGSSNADCGAIDSASNGISLVPYNNASGAATGRSSSANIVIPNGTFYLGGNFGTFINRSDSTKFTSGRHGRDVSADISTTAVAPASATEFVWGAANVNGTIGTGSGRIIGAGLLCPSLTTVQRKEAYAAIQWYIESVRWGEVPIIDAGVGPTTVTVDTLSIGFNFASIICAVTAKRRAIAQGRSDTVAMLGGERDRTTDALGGMAANGLGYTDLYAFSSVGGLTRAVFTWINGVVGRSDANGQNAFNVEGRLFNAAMRRLLDPTRTGTFPGYDIPVYAGDRVTSITFASGLYTVKTGDGRTFIAKTVIDHTDSQETFTPAGLPYIYGKEAKGTGLEANAGYQGPAQFDLPHKAGSGTTYRIDPFKTPGSQASGLINGVTYPPSTPINAADPTTQSYGHRLQLTTDKSLSIPWDTTPPYAQADIDADNEYLARLLAADNTITFANLFNYHTINAAGTVYDFNTAEGLLPTMDIPGSGTAWVNAIISGTFADREAIWKNVELKTRGRLFWLRTSTDTRIPAAVQTAANTFYRLAITNLNPHPNDDIQWSNQVYVRECLRLVGDYKMVGSDFATDGTTPRSTKTVGAANYAADDHIHGMVAYDPGGGLGFAVYSSGGYYDTASVQGDMITPIPMDVMLLPANHAKGAGFLTTVGISASQVAFSVCRMEPVRAELGQAAGEIAALRAELGTDIRLLDYEALIRPRILSGGDAVAPVLPQLN